ncbi:hypothetical protein CDL15_Pgr010857 [Punica granatum]|uniref:Myb/SANT-like domain-containing protein n=1 Tax=Punica granatum TaxID=22663 RepID=A0A218W5Y1_PUNGR|nr:hypothetical protein CDL15_Pgr010857 [Punica granatum]
MCASCGPKSASIRALKGEHVLEWSDEMELAFIHIMLEKFKVRDKCARLKGTYKQFTELKNNTGVGCDADTNTNKASSMSGICSSSLKSASIMTLKGEHVLEWSDEMELVFIHIMLEKFKTKVRDKCARLKRTYKQFTKLKNHTGVGWDAGTNTIKASPDVWDMFIKKNRAFKAFRTKGCKHYTLLNELFSSSIATGALRISSTNPPTTSSEERRLHAAFMSASRGKQK